MGLFDFAKDLGRKLFSSEDEAPTRIKEHIEEDNPGLDNLEVSVNDGVVSLKGEAQSAEALEKAVLMAGNVAGVSQVVADEVNAPEQSTEVEYYEIQKGDSLWKIAANYYGNGNEYKRLFEQNREVIKDPDLIFPGQKIRIPKID